MRLRPWQLVIALVALCAVAVGVLMYARRDPDLNAAQMLAYLPKREAAVYYMDLRPLRESGLLGRLVGKAVDEEEEYKAFVASTGFDYKTDLDVIAASSIGNSHLFLLRGRFDWEALIRYANSNGGTCQNGFCNVPSSRASRIVSFYPVSRSLMGFAVDDKEFAATLIKEQGNAPFIPPDKPVWLSVPSARLKDSEKMPEGTRIFAKAVENAERVIFSLGQKEKQDALELSMDVTCKTEQEAKVLRAQLEGLTTIFGKLLGAQGGARASGDMGAMLSSGVFESSGARVTGRWPIEPALLDALTGG